MAELDIEAVTVRIEKAMQALLAAKTQERCWVTHYGANHIHPRHLVYWLCVLSDSEKRRLESDSDFKRQLRALLVEHEYPLSGRDHVFIGFESQETVTRDSGGNWWYHWK